MGVRATFRAKEGRPRVRGRDGHELNHARFSVQNANHNKLVEKHFVI